MTLGIIEVAYISYMQRASMLEVIRSDYVRTARAKGLPERSVILKHSLKNALIPVLTIAGIDLGALMGGAILTETRVRAVRCRPMVYYAINARDLPVVVAACCSPPSSMSSPTWWSTWPMPTSTRGSAMSSGR